tara:strand:+ start:533 stop:1612 length:1080 start_codon:yes stop_codon:yes gene_type:complete
MALPSSGQIKFSEIKDEFGYSSMGGYRVSESYGGFDFALDNDTCGPNANASIPTSGAIKFSDFYNARRNIVVDFYSNPSGEEYRRSIRKRFKANNYIIVGGHGPNQGNNTTGRKVVAVINKTLGSENTRTTGNTICALETGNWSDGTTLEIKVGPQGAIYGAGGAGGVGGEGNNSGTGGGFGTSAIGIEYTNTPVTIRNNGRIQAGYGGGGGGAGRSRSVKSGKKSRKTAVSTGGGGGGGAGYPQGQGGGVNGSPSNGGSAGSNGGNATKKNFGSAGGGGSEAGDGGTGGGSNMANPNTAATAPDGNGSGGAGTSSGGNNGYAIVTNSTNTSYVVYSGSGTKVGRTIYGADPSWPGSGA